MKIDLKYTHINPMITIINFNFAFIGTFRFRFSFYNLVNYGRRVRVKCFSINLLSFRS